MSKDELMERAMSLKDPLAARVFLILMATNPATEGEARTLALAFGLGCSTQELERAFKALAAAGIGDLVDTRWLQ